MAITYASAWYKHVELGHPPVPHGPVLLVGVRSLSGRVGEVRVEATSDPWNSQISHVPQSQPLHPGSMAFACEYLVMQNGVDIP